MRKTIPEIAICKNYLAVWHALLRCGSSVKKRHTSKTQREAARKRNDFVISPNHAALYLWGCRMEKDED
jgi:hypothetical protein